MFTEIEKIMLLRAIEVYKVNFPISYDTHEKSWKEIEEKLKKMMTLEKIKNL